MLSIFMNVVVAKYTGADLTQLSDRLVAIHGTAMQIHCCTGLTYLGSLWKENLHLEPPLA